MQKTISQEKLDINPAKVQEFNSTNGLEEELDNFTRQAVLNIRFALIIKPAIISFIALIISFFLDLSSVPLLGNVTIDLTKNLFPGWEPPTEAIEPFNFWWLPLAVYALFVFLAFLAYNKLRLEIVRTPASETIDRVINSYASVIDSISTALPLIGAAILLISIKLGEEVFLGLSVPFEVKALIVLALGKLFEPVLDQLGVEFQNVVNHVKDIKDRYFSKIQIENSKSLIKQLSGGSVAGSGVRVPEITAKDLEHYKTLLEQTNQISEQIYKNFSSVNYLLEKINNTQNISAEKIEQLKSLANSISQASASLSDEKTITGLKHLESIVRK
ncbi:MAG: hypothetical protein IPM56_13580 [Ignavibacteriales bacterium]|nr:MAG: hypothetical protein IPM56_13580 [Ignavibacteriales bacterium]